MFRPGDRVVCVDAKGSARLLREARVYVIASVAGRYVVVEGVPFLYPGFFARRFRFPPPARPTDISVLTALLAPTRSAPALVDA